MLFGKNLRRRSKLVFAAAAVLCLAGIGTPAYADLYFGYSLSTSADVADNNQLAFDSHHDGSTSEAMGAEGGIQGDAIAAASYGVLHVYAHGVASSTQGTNANVHAQALFDDMVTIKGGTGIGYLNADLIGDGTIFNGSATKGAVFTNLGVTWSNSIGNRNISLSQNSIQSGDFTFAADKTIQFTYGVPFEYYAKLDADINWGFATNASGEGYIDFAHTLMLGNIQVLDSNFNPVSNFTITGSTGTNYAALVPEPTSATLLLAGSVMPMLRRKRRIRMIQGA